MKGAWGEKAARLYLEKRGWHTAATYFIMSSPADRSGIDTIFFGGVNE